MSCTPRRITPPTPAEREAALSWMAGRLAWERTLDRIRTGGRPLVPAAHPVQRRTAA